MEEEAQQNLDLARQWSSTNYRKSFEFYLKAFEKNPDLKTLLEVEFRDVLLQHNEVLLHDNKMEDIFSNFSKALELFPNNYFLMNDIGKYLYKFAFYAEAWCHFKKALDINSNFVNAERNLNSIKNLLLERWHFRMLNDKIRNDAYYNALSESILRLKDTVLDIGTGTGILAMFASECSACAVTGIEASEVLASMAERVTHTNNKDDILIINKMSTTMNYRDIGGKRTLLVTEMFDAGLFGEQILQTLSHAWEYFTIPITKIIPNKAEFFVMAANSEHLDRKYRLGLSAKKLLNIPDYNVQVITNDDPYDCEDIHLLKDIKYLTEPQSLLKIDFNNYRDIQEKLSNTEPYKVKLIAKEDDDMNVVIGWFNLYLTKNITLTTDPRSDKRSNAWQQAVFFDFLPKSVKKNHALDLDFSIHGGKLTMGNYFTSPIFKISPDVLRFLNDTEYMKMITTCIGMASVYLGQMENMSLINIVDLCPFPVFGLMMMKRGAHSLVCMAKNNSDIAFLKRVFRINRVALSKVTILEGDDWGPEIFGEEKFHAVFCNILDMCGDIETRLRDIAVYLKNNHLEEGGLFMPANIMLHIEVVNSHWVDINNRVYDENVRNYKIAKHINSYEVTQNFCIDFTHLEYTPITEPMNLGTIETDIRAEVVNIPVTRDGPANAILCWYTIELMADLLEISTRRADSFTDGMLYLINPNTPYVQGTSIRILRCVDPDGSFMLKLVPET